MATKIVTAEDIKLINQTYYETHNKAETARRTGFTNYMVNKYIVPHWKPETERVIKHFTHEQLPEYADAHKTVLPISQWFKYCTLTDDEKQEMKVLWEELDA